MRKDKRGMALITAIAVLALMLILFDGPRFFYCIIFCFGDRHYKRNFRLIKDIKVAT